MASAGSPRGRRWWRLGAALAAAGATLLALITLGLAPAQPGYMVTGSLPGTPTPSPVAPQPRTRPGGAPPPGSGPIQTRGPVRVVSGDTIETLINGGAIGVGLIGIRAPPGNTPCGKEAIAQLRSLVKGGLRLDEDPVLTFDGRKRRLYYAHTPDGRSVAVEMARAGVAWPTGEGGERGALAAAGQEARAAGRGCLWNPAAAPRPAAGTPPPRTTPLPSPAGAAPAPAPARRATTLPGGFTQTVVAEGLTEPTAFAFLPDGRVLIAEKVGLVRVYQDGTLLPTPFLDLRDRVNDYWDRGLLGLAVDPNFSANGSIYLYYVFENDPAQYDGRKTSRLARYTAVGSTAALTSEVVLLGSAGGGPCDALPVWADCIPADVPNHNGGGIRFAADGSLFLSTGDAASPNLVDDDALRAQDIDDPSGKLLHITQTLAVTPTGVGLPTNPFWNGDPNAIRSKVWAYGLRNPFRFTLRPSSGLPYVADVGWNDWEEIDVATAGANLGWPCYEGPAQQADYAFKPTCQALYNQGAANVQPPLISYPHVDAEGNETGASVTGGAFSTGANYPDAYRGAYVYGDYAQGFLRYLQVDSSDHLLAGPSDFADGTDGPVDIEQGPDDDLYYLAIYVGELRRIQYNAPVGTPTPRPTPLPGAPTVTIDSPSPARLYRVGDVIAYSGSATDAQGAAIPPSGLSWNVVIHHCPGGVCHTHFFMSGRPGASGSFTVPDHGDDSYFELTLSATDSAGRRGAASVAIHPQTLTLTLATDPSGLRVVYGGVSGTSPFTRTTIAGSTHTLFAPSPQGSLSFSSWSDGGAQQHNVTVGTADTIFTATFTQSSAITLATAPNPSTYGQSVVVSATVAAAGGVGPTGTVTFSDGVGAVLGAAPVNAAGVATLTLPRLSVGTHLLSALFVDATSSLSRTSNVVTQVVQPLSTTTTLAGQPNPSAYFGQPVVFTMTASAAGAPAGLGPPSGTVTLNEGGVPLGAAPLNASGVATLTLSSLATGTHTLTAAYTGAPPFATSVSEPSPQTVSGPFFADVTPAASDPFAYAYPSIQAAYLVSLTTGIPCAQIGPTGCQQAGGKPFFLPASPITRDQLAAFLVRAKHSGPGETGWGYSPPPARGRFADVPIDDFWAPFIEQALLDGITTGVPCGTAGAGPCDSQRRPYFLPHNPVLRDQMAVFLVRAARGAGFTPPPAQGRFADLPTSYWAAPFIEQALLDGITTGVPCGTAGAGACDGQNRPYYLPASPVPRGQMAVFLIRTFHPSP